MAVLLINPSLGNSELTVTSNVAVVDAPFTSFPPTGDAPPPAPVPN